MLKIKSVEYISDYKLKILFNDNKSKIVDFVDWINEGTEYLVPLKKLDYFKKVKIDDFHYTICWPNGAEFSPDVLYEKGTTVTKRKATASRLKTRPKKGSMLI